MFKHIGSARSSQELESLKLIAQDVIKNSTSEIPLFEEAKLDNLLYLDKSEFLGVYSTFLYDVIFGLIAHIGLDKIKKRLLLDLVIIRVVEPASKLRSIELIDTYFGIKHRRQSYRALSRALQGRTGLQDIEARFANKATECKKVTEARMLNKITSKEIRIRTNQNDKQLNYLKSLKLSH